MTSNIHDGRSRIKKSPTDALLLILADRQEEKDRPPRRLPLGLQRQGSTEKQMTAMDIPQKRSNKRPLELWTGCLGGFLVPFMEKARLVGPWALVFLDLVILRWYATHVVCSSKKSASF